MIDPKQYPVEVQPLSAEEGGGWFATFPDLDGCHGDDDTPSEAIEDGYFHSPMISKFSVSNERSSR